MVTVGSGQEERRITEACTTHVIDLATYNRKVSADETRWTTGYTNFEAQTPPPAYYHDSPLMRLPTELRLQILTCILFDPDEVTFKFPRPSRAALFLDALKQHAVQIPSSYAERDVLLPLQTLFSLDHNPRLAPLWKDQIFVEVGHQESGTPQKHSNARRLYAQREGECVHLRKVCLICHIHCHYQKHKPVPHHRVNGQVLRVRKGMYHDALPLLYNLNVFAFENAYEMGAVLHAVGPGRAFIRYIDVKSKLFHGGVLWEYLLPCKNIRQMYLTQSFTYTMMRGGQGVSIDADNGAGFFGGWMIRGGEAFFDMVRTRERGSNNPLQVLSWYGGCKDVAINRATNEAVRARLNVNEEAGPSASTSHYLPIFENPFPPKSSAVEYYAWKDTPVGLEKTEAPSTLDRLCWRLYYAALHLLTYRDAMGHAYVQAKDELARLKKICTLRNAVALPKIVINGGAHVVGCIVVGVPWVFFVTTAMLIMFAIYLLVELVRDTINFLRLHISRPWRVLANKTTAKTDTRRVNSNGRPRV